MHEITEEMAAELCWRLRWKGMLIEAEPDRSIRGTSDGFCWCTHTMNCLGPDGQVADRGRCRPGRPCHERR